MIKARWLTGFVLVVALLAVGIGLAGALADGMQQNSGQGDDGGLIVDASVSTTSAISYQGRLTSPDGSPLNGTYTMRFIVYDDAVAGSTQWDSGNVDVTVEDGLFNVQLGVDHAHFDGQALWLSIRVEGQTLSPRQEILPAPYALSLRPGAQIVGPPSNASGAVVGAAMEGDWPAASVISGVSAATGTAGHFQSSGGQGLNAYSENAYGISGASDNSWGGFFQSNEGYGVRVVTSGDDHWDHAGYFSADSGYGIYVESANNMAVRGEAGDISGLWQPVGNVGVVGIGQSRGVYGSAGSSYGLYGTSLNWYGIYGRTSRTDNNYGLYTPDNLFSSNINIAGAMMQVAQNGGQEALQAGDVVVFSGLDFSETEDRPIVQVARTNQAGSQAVAGVVHSRFNYAVVVQEGLSDEQLLDGQVEITPAGAVAPGEYLLLVIQGLAQMRVEGVSSSVQPGDLLSTSTVPGAATRTEQFEISGVQSAPPGTVVGKALQAVEGTEDLIYTFVTLQ